MTFGFSKYHQVTILQKETDNECCASNVMVIIVIIMMIMMMIHKKVQTWATSFALRQFFLICFCSA